MDARGRWVLGLMALFVVGALVFNIMQADQASITDRLAIQDAISQYAYRWDAKDATGFVDLFTEDTVIERWLLGKRQSRLEGRDSLLEYAIRSHEGRLADRQTRHHMSGLVFVELADDSAITENTVLITHQTAADDAPKIAGAGIYRMTWHRTPTGWKIAKRVLFSDKIENSSG